VEGADASLSPGVDLAAYRIVQEALTNALKHARATTVDVRVRYGERELDLTVADDGVGAGSNHAGGHGLVGMRERVVLYGGTLRTGPGEHGGFRVQAMLPIHEVASP
jgi:signal transduction histidine kinase